MTHDHRHLPKISQALFIYALTCSLLRIDNMAITTQMLACGTVMWTSLRDDHVSDHWSIHKTSLEITSLTCGGCTNLILLLLLCSLRYRALREKQHFSLPMGGVQRGFWAAFTQESYVKKFLTFLDWFRETSTTHSYTNLHRQAAIKE